MYELHLVLIYENTKLRVYVQGQRGTQGFPGLAGEAGAKGEKVQLKPIWLNYKWWALHSKYSAVQFCVNNVQQRQIFSLCPLPPVFPSPQGDRGVGFPGPPGLPGPPGPPRSRSVPVSISVYGFMLCIFVCTHSMYLWYILHILVMKSTCIKCRWGLSLVGNLRAELWSITNVCVCVFICVTVWSRCPGFWVWRPGQRHWSHQGKRKATERGGIAWLFNLHRANIKSYLSTRVLPVHQGLQDLLVQQDPTCHHLTQLQASLQGMLDHPVSLAETGCQANLEYQ